jgi:hypothetical protein
LHFVALSCCDLCSKFNQNFITDFKTIDWEDMERMGVAELRRVIEKDFTNCDTRFVCNYTGSSPALWILENPQGVNEVLFRQLRKKSELFVGKQHL